ncbi:MAG: cache domain-containing protein [Synergistetes bacterium]|nr:cache domain-containing protein [Synergistota bacterium]MDW8191755.1 cache domain-containing protein [Synergistota bacterium]
MRLSQMGLKIRIFSLTLLISITILSFFYINKLERDLREREILGASVLVDTVTFLFRSRIQSLTVMLHSLNYIQLPALEDNSLRDWLLIFYRAYEPFVYLSGFVDRNGKVLMTYPKDDALEGKDISSWRSFKTVKAARIGFIGETITTSRGDKGIGIFAPVFDEGKGFRGAFFYVYNYQVLIDALSRYLKALKVPWNPLLVDSDGNVILGDEKVAKVLLEEAMEKVKSTKLDGIEYISVYSHVPLGVTLDWHFFLYAPLSSLGRELRPFSLFLKTSLTLVTAIITAVVLIFHRRRERESVSFPEIVELKEEVKPVELEESRDRDPLEELRELFPGVIIELDRTLDVVSIKGEHIPPEGLDKEEIKRLVKKGEGTLRVGERVFLLRVAPLRRGGFLLFGEDKTKEEAIFKAIEDNLVYFLSGRFLKEGKDSERIKEVILSERDSFGRVSLNKLLLDLKDKLSFEELELRLEDFLPSPWINPLYLKGVILALLLKVMDGKGKPIIETRYLKEKTMVSLKLYAQGIFKLFGERDPEFFILSSFALKGGMKLRLLERPGEETCVEIELPIYPFLDEEGNEG